MTDSGTYTPETLARRAKMAEALFTQGVQPQQIDHWTQGLAQMARAGLGGYQLNKIEQQEKEGGKATREALAAMLGGGAMPGAVPGPQPTQPLPAPPPSNPAATDALPRGIRNNNPLNIEAGGFTQGQPGFQGSDGRFARFQNPDQGIAAADKLLQVYANKHGLNTPSGIIGRWAPASDNNNVQSYAGRVAKALGSAPDAPLNMQDPAVRQRLIAAMAEVENGRPIQMGGAPQPQMALQAPAAAPGTPPGAPLPQQPTPGAPPSSPAAGDPKTRIAEMLRSPNPFVQKMGQQMAMGIIQKQMLGSEETNDTKEYNRAVQQGFKGTLFDYQKQLKEAGKPVTNINQQQESEFQKEAGKFYGGRYGEMVKGASEANEIMADIGNLRDIGSRITTGKTAEIKAALGPYAEAMGIKVEGLDDMQAYQAIISKMVPRMRVPGSGATSDFDMRTFMNSLPALGKTPEGNEMIANTMQALVEHKVAAGEIANRALSGEISRTEAEKQIKALGDPLALWKKNKGALPSSRAGAPAPPPAAKSAPAVGAVQDGYRFKGGDPAKRESWEQVI